MQGEATEATVLHALELLSQLPLDVICIVRGGGSKTDLVYFDSEAICRAIAACPVPVLTGIGHEIDNSLADLVAHADKITPTDCAKFLEGWRRTARAPRSSPPPSIAEAWRMEYQQAGHDLAQRAAVLRREWEGRRVAEDLRCREQARLLASQRGAPCARRSRRLRARRGRASPAGPKKLLRLERLRFANRSQAMGHAWARWRDAGARRSLRPASACGSDAPPPAAETERRSRAWDAQGARRAAWRGPRCRCRPCAGCCGGLAAGARRERGPGPQGEARPCRGSGAHAGPGFSILRGGDGRAIRSAAAARRAGGLVVTSSSAGRDGGEPR